MTLPIMLSGRRTAGGVAAYFDLITDEGRLFYGDSFHFGYFRTGSETLAQALDAHTDLVAERARLTGRQHILDVGCGLGAPAQAGLPARLEQLGVGERVAHTVAYVALVTGGVWLARRALSGFPTLGLGASLLVITSAWVLPWYSTWPLALAAVEEDVLTQAVALGLALYLLPDRVPV